MSRIVVLGSGESGVGAALLAKARGYDVFVSDKGMISDANKTELSQANISFEEGMHTEHLILNANLIIKSPGIPEKAPIIQEIRKAQIELISEIEFGFREAAPNTKYVAITGSNGKTTTTLLTYHIFKEIGFSVGLAGNVGYSLARQVINQELGLFVLELSSFQLDDIKQFRADVSILLNITPDHLDRYNYSFDQYAQAKLNIIKNALPTDSFIYYKVDPYLNDFVSNNTLSCKVLAIDDQFNPTASYYNEDTITLKNYNQETYLIPTQQLSLKGKHNIVNTMSALVAVWQMGGNIEKAFAATHTFKNASHRLETVAVIDKRTFINDSKATNVDSVYYALDSIDKNSKIVWIAGGVDKGNDYSQIENLILEKVHTLISLNKDHNTLLGYMKSRVRNIVCVESMEAAVVEAYKNSNEGDVVLLSPACASFDLFKNYEDRGDQFKKYVLEIKTLV